VLGERLQYVLLPGERLQDDAAEDPLTAALGNRQADCELYWRTKLQKPLQEIFTTCLTPNALQVLPLRHFRDICVHTLLWGADRCVHPIQNKSGHICRQGCKAVLTVKSEDHSLTT